MGKLSEFSTTPPAQLKMIRSRRFVSRSWVAAHLLYSHKTLPSLSTPCAECKRCPNPKDHPREEAVNAAHIRHLPSRVENWAESNMYLSLHLVFMVLTLGPDIQPAWLLLHIPYSWFDSVHQNTTRQNWQQICCLPQRLLWKHLERNRDVVNSQPFSSRLFMPFITCVGQGIPAPMAKKPGYK